MVIETAEGNPQQESGKTNLPCVDNIMSGISNTGRVKMNNHKKKLRQKFDIIRKLGQGTYGKVQLGINKGTGQEVAIKTIKKCKIETEADLVRIRREVQIMSSVQHPNIIHIYEVFENREKMVLVMEFASGGELYDYLSERKVLEEDEARRIFRQIAIAVYYCHKHRICHRDLKLENILLDDQGNAKIADFGLSNIYDGSNLLATFCGSPLYASPEIVKGTPYQGPEVDCWSLGVLLYTLVYGAMPFDGSNFKRLVKQISAGEYYEPKKPSPASGLIREMLTVCPKRRATIEQICNNSWVNEGYQEPCLALAEELANQTPVRLDVLLALSAPAPNADQLVVNSESGQNDSGVARSQSLGSMRDMITDEAEKRILDMVQQQEAEDEHRVAGIALQESPTRVISSCVPEEDVAGHPKRKLDSAISTENANLIQTKREKAGMSNASIQLIQTKEDESLSKIQETPREDRNFDSLDLETLESTNDISESPTVAEDAEIVKDTKSLSQQTTKSATSATVVPSPKENRILTRKKSMPEKSSVPHYSQISRGRELEQSANIAVIAARLEKIQPQPTATIETQPTVPKPEILSKDVSESSIKSTTSDFSLDEARRSMENSIALLNKAKNESMEYQPTAEPVNELDELGSLDPIDRQRKLKNAREVIGNAINPRFGIRKPQLAFGKNGRSISGSVVPMSSSEFGKTNLKAQQVTPEPEEDQLGTLPQSNVKTSHAEIHLKSATLPRRKTAKTEIKLQIKNPETPMFFQTEMAHRMPDFRNNAVPVPQMSSSSRSSMDRRSSLESPQTKSTASVSTYRSGSVSKSTQPGTPSTPSTINDNYQPIKKSPREFIIPIAIESGEIITPRASSLEPSKASSIASSSSTFSRFGAPSSQFSHDSDLTEPHHFALHRLRSSRPINKFAESNDSGSSGDEDDEDGFEILTAGDLFSTLLSRVQAFTQRMNIGNDSNFPKSRLFKNNMRQTTDNPFWFSDSFGRKPHSYSIKTEITHEYRRDVRTVPWRHSMSRDLFSNADALLASARASAVAKLPRGEYKK